MNAIKQTIRHEAMRIGGEKVTTSDVVEVRYPYTDQVIGTAARRRRRTRPPRVRDRGELPATTDAL